jgi:hypothetical protein
MKLSLQRLHFPASGRQQSASSHRDHVNKTPPGARAATVESVQVQNIFPCTSVNAEQMVHREENRKFKRIS